MIRYCFKVYDFDSKDIVTSVICDCEHMIDTIKELNKLGIVKGYILNEKLPDEM